MARDGYAAVAGRTAAARGPHSAASFARGGSADWPRGCRVHPADRAAGDAALSRGKRGVAPRADSHGRVAGHGLPALAIFSGCARQRRAADQGGDVRARRRDHHEDAAREIFLHCHHSRKRNSPGTRRTFGTSGRGHRLRAGTKAGVTAGKCEGAHPHRRGSGHCGGVQHTAGGGAFFARRNHGRPERAGAGLGGAGVGDLVAGFAAAARQ